MHLLDYYYAAENNVRPLDKGRAVLESNWSNPSFIHSFIQSRPVFSAVRPCYTAPLKRRRRRRRRRKRRRRKKKKKKKSIYLYLQMKRLQPLGRLYKSRYMPSTDIAFRLDKLNSIFYGNLNKMVKGSNTYQCKIYNRFEILTNNIQINHKRIALCIIISRLVENEDRE